MLTSGNPAVARYLWGLDLSGNLTDGGGVSGLLAILDVPGSAVHLPLYDANGNVHALVNRSGGALTATYEYSPFGETLRATGTYAAGNSFRFSTQYTDQETQLLYYGRRYYNPTLGRWLGRDPIEEKGGLHLYAFVSNNPVNRYDVLGMDGHDDIYYAAVNYFLGMGCSAQQACALAEPSRSDIENDTSGPGYLEVRASDNPSFTYGGYSNGNYVDQALQPFIDQSLLTAGVSSTITDSTFLTIPSGSPANTPSSGTPFVDVSQLRASFENNSLTEDPTTHNTTPAGGPNSVTTTTQIQIVGRTVEDPLALGTQHTFVVVTSGTDSVVASAQPSKKLGFWGEVKNFFGSDQGVVIQPQGLTPTSKSSEYGKFTNQLAQNPSGPYQSNVVVVDRSYTTVVDQINRFNAAVRDAQIRYTSTSQNSNSYTFTLMQYLTGTDPGSTSKAPGSGTRLNLGPGGP